MSNHPSRFPPFYITVFLFFLVRSAFCAESELTEIQKQARIYRVQGYELQKEEKFEAALIYYQKALYLDPSYVVLYNDIGIIYETLGDIARAEEMYLKATEIDPGYPNSYTNLALLYEGQKDYAKAVVCWIRRSVLGGVNDPWAQAARKRLGEIEQAAPGAYRQIEEEYKANLKQASKGQAALGKHAYLSSEGPKVSLFSSDKGPETVKFDNKSRAANNLRSAKENFARREYVTALKEATVAGYLDPSNNEINEFVEKVRRKLLE
ncbi:MAG: tetratricopeptide repeat protein [Candidatus Omnitrophica bacterium]|nr:tetratricopeptide repeat protein [Candidatus Omnitrophota bacterium]